MQFVFALKALTKDVIEEMINEARASILYVNQLIKIIVMSLIRFKRS